jgi:hypothetical protein
MDRGSRIYLPCLAATKGSRPLEQCRISPEGSLRRIERSCVSSSSHARRKRVGAVTRHQSKQSTLLQ